MAFALNPINERRWQNFRSNRRAWWSLWIFLILFIISLFAELIANDKPILLKFEGEIYAPVFRFYPETAFGGDFETEADYHDEYVQELLEADEGGWQIWPLIPFFHDTISHYVDHAPSPPSVKNWLGTDSQARDVTARLIYGFRLSVLFGLSLTFFSTIIGVAAGAVQGYFGGRIDLLFQRFIEIWSSTPELYVIMIIAAIITPSFWVLLGILLLFSWTALVGVVRAEFLRARNFEYVNAARALGVSNTKIMWRHVLPNAMVATLTMMPFILTGAISTLASLDFLGFGLPVGTPSLGEMARQGQQNPLDWWLGVTAFFTFAIMLSLLVFIFEGVRDAFDPRKTFT